jgi:RNA polymerase primary sigma factor
MRMSAVRPASLDAQIDGDDSGSYAETISDEKAESPHDKLDRKAGAVMMREIVQTLDQRERVILRLRFGLDGESPKTLDEIGQELGVSSERVRQLQKAALKKVRCRMNNLEYRSLSPKKLKSGNNCKLRL